MKIATSALLLALLAWLAWFAYSGGFGPPEWPAEDGGAGPFAALIALVLILATLFAGIALVLLAALLLGTLALLWNIVPLLLPLLAVVLIAWLVVAAYRRRHVKTGREARIVT